MGLAEDMLTQLGDEGRDRKDAYVTNFRVRLHPAVLRYCGKRLRDRRDTDVTDALEVNTHNMLR